MVVAGGRDRSKKPDLTFISDILQSTDKIRRRTIESGPKKNYAHHWTIVSYYELIWFEFFRAKGTKVA